MCYLYAYKQEQQKWKTIKKNNGETVLDVVNTRLVTQLLRDGCVAQLGEWGQQAACGSQVL